jgi:hypothetical protein
MCLLCESPFLSRQSMPKQQPRAVDILAGGGLTAEHPYGTGWMLSLAWDANLVPMA